MPTALYITDNSFRTGSLEHWIWIFYGIFSTILWIWMGRRAANYQEKQRIGFQMMLIGIAAWIYAEVVMLLSGQSTFGTAIPLHLCYFLGLILPFVFLKQRADLLDWFYPIIMAGCLQALITPDLTEAFPHFFGIRYWLVHIALVQCVLYAIWVLGFRPSAGGILKCILFLHIFALAVTPFNILLNTNFLYLRRPAGGSIMALMGPWPWYLLGLEVLMVLLFILVYLPWLLIRQQQQPTIQNVPPPL